MTGPLCNSASWCTNDIFGLNIFSEENAVCWSRFPSGPSLSWYVAQWTFVSLYRNLRLDIAHIFSFMLGVTQVTTTHRKNGKSATRAPSCVICPMVQRRTLAHPYTLGAMALQPWLASHEAVGAEDSQTSAKNFQIRIFMLSDPQEMCAYFETQWSLISKAMWIQQA